MSLSMLLDSALRSAADHGHAGPKTSIRRPEATLAAREQWPALTAPEAVNYDATAAKQASWDPRALPACNEPANARTLTWANAEPVQRQGRQLAGYTTDDRSLAALRLRETAGHVPSYVPDGSAQKLYGLRTEAPPKGYVTRREYE